MNSLLTTIRCFFLIGAFSLTISSCRSRKPDAAAASPDTPPTQNEELVWMQLDPVQCNGNPWEEAFGPATSAEQELPLVKKYYEGKGIRIFQINMERTHDFVCEACTCPRGETIYVQMRTADVAAMKEMKWKEKN